MSLIFLVDWLQFTLHKKQLPEVFELIGIPESEFVDMPTGRYSYPGRKSFGGISVLYGARADMGIHVEFTGQGCREYETYFDVPWPLLFDRIVREEGDFSRLDLSIDEHRYNGDPPFWTVRQLVRKAKQGAVRSKFKTAHQIEKIKLSDGSSDGHTIYFGSSASDIQFRVYEKNKEREAQGKQLEETLTTWNRFEVQLADDRALKAVMACLEGRTADHLINGIIRHYISFCERSRDTNKARWPVCKWWLDFLGDAEKLKLAEKAPDKTIEAKQEWINRQVQPTLAEVWIALGSPGNEFFTDLINEGLERMTDRQWERAQSYRARWLQEQDEISQRRKERRRQQLEALESELAARRRQIAATREHEKEPLRPALMNDPVTGQ